MKNHVITTIVCIGLLLACLTAVHSQTVFLDCTSETRSLCVNDPGISLPDSNRFVLGSDIPGSTSCGVHIAQSRMISSHCVGSIDYYVALVVNDTIQEILQPVKTVYVDFSNQALLTYDTRTAASAAIRKHGLSYNQGCNDVHTIRWVMLDNCGNEVVCEERVQLYDCQPPNVLLHKQPVIIRISVGCSISATARDMVADIIDDCISPESFLYSFDAEEYRPDTFFFCDIVPALGVELSGEIWIADQGIDSNCDGTIDWSERTLHYVPTSIVFVETNDGCHCGLWEPNYLTGNVHTVDGRPIEKVAVNLTAPGKVFPTYVTAQNGEFIFNNVIFPDTYTIKASRNDNHRNGVSTLDIIRIYQHLLGIDTLDNPYKIIAADVNNSTNVSFIDIVELSKLILGIYTELPGFFGPSNSWKFVSADHEFAETMYLWPIDETIEITSSSDSASFIGIKIGDVNNSVKPVDVESPFEPAFPIMTFTTSQQYYHRGDIIEIPVAMSHDRLVSGFQFTISDPHLEFLEVDPVGLQSNHPSSIQSFIDTETPGGKHHLTALWFDTGSVVFDPAKILFIIKARATYSGNLAQSLSMNSAKTEAEAYDEDEKMYKPILHVKSSGRQMLLSPPTPNPWTDETTLSFYLPAASKVQMMISDQSSAVIYTMEMEGHEGRNEVVLRAADINASGLLFIALKSADSIEYQKMMLVR